MIKYGVQMFGLRDITPVDMKAALKAVADIGYKQVEFAGFFEHSPEKIRSYLDEYGLEAISTHSVMDKITPEQIKQTVKEHKIIGADKLTVPGVWMATREDLDRSIELLNFAEPILSSEGITLSVHNHAREFIRTDYGALAHEELEAKTRVMFQLDTFWTFFAGRDPIERMEYYHSIGRLSMIHIKDGLLDRSSKALGEGDAPVKAVLDKALELRIPIIVESEGLDPTGAEENARCFEFLRKNG